MLRDQAAVKMQRGLALVAAGSFGEGWDEYRFRFEAGGGDRRFRQPEWLGEPLAGRSILVHREQGVGDEIWFAGCLPDLSGERPGRILLSCDVRLEPLLARSFPEIELLPGEPAVDDWERLRDLDTDFHVALGCLHRRFRRRREDFPGRAGYRGFLRADAAHAAFCRRRRELLGEGLAVGISWQGGPSLAELRKIPWDFLCSLLRAPGARFFDLQYGDTRALRQRLEELGIHLQTFPDADNWSDLDGLAARISALDLVITVPNTTAHLAGALGVPTWILHSPAWGCCWLPAGDETPWYPCARVFRKGETGWQGVLATVQAELERASSRPLTPRVGEDRAPAAGVRAPPLHGSRERHGLRRRDGVPGPAGAGARPFSEVLGRLAPSSAAYIALVPGETARWLAARGASPSIDIVLSGGLLQKEAGSGDRGGRARALVLAAHDRLPLGERSIAWATAFDVLPRLSPEEGEGSVAELVRIARDGFLVSVDTTPSTARVRERLVNVHRTVRPLEWWIERIAALAGTRPLLLAAGREHAHGLLVDFRDRHR